MYSHASMRGLLDEKLGCFTIENFETNENCGLHISCEKERKYVQSLQKFISTFRVQKKIPPP